MKKGIDFLGVAVAFACHDGEGNFLFLKRGLNCRDFVGVWETGGGGVRFQESIEEALHRELQEELCVSPLSYECVGYHETITKGKEDPRHWLMLGFIVEVDPTQVKIGEPDCVEEFMWQPLDSVPDSVHPGVPPFMKNIRAHLSI